ncbi:BspA family leucine-rich repeat surface protein, partial [Enterococcus faecium]|nr:BspA family leucine-rich repeat surface protein [Enterococcus faecium]
MSKKYKMLRLLATTSIIATNIFPVTPQLPQIVVQAATLQEEQETSAIMGTEKQADASNVESAKTINSEGEIPQKETETTTNTDSEVQLTPKKTESSESTEQTAEKEFPTNSNSEKGNSKEESTNKTANKENQKKSNRSVITGTWGKVPYTFDESTGTLTLVGSGLLGKNGQQPWVTGEVSADNIKKIEFTAAVTAPVDSTRLFSADDTSKRLVKLQEITGLNKVSVLATRNMYDMFSECRSLKSLDLNSWNSASVEDMSHMFYGCDNLSQIILGKNLTLDTTTDLPEGIWSSDTISYVNSYDFQSNSRGLTGTFLRYETDGNVRTGYYGSSAYGFNEVKGKIDFFSGTLGLDGEQPWIISSIGGNVKKIEFIGNVVAPEDSSRLFSSGSDDIYERLFKLTEFIGWENLDLSHVTKAYDMFSNCQALESLDLSSLDTSKITDMSHMFFQCYSLNELILGEKSIFDSTTDLPEGNWFGQNTKVPYTSSVDFMSNYDGSQPDTFEKYDAVGTWGTSPYTFDETTVTLTVYSGNLGELGEQPWVKGGAPSYLKKIEFVGDVVAPTNSMRLFSADAKSKTLTRLQEITGLENLDTSQVTNMNYMFYNCWSLQSLDLSSFDTSQVTDMSYMFSSCS